MVEGLTLLSKVQIVVENCAGHPDGVLEPAAKTVNEHWRTIEPASKGLRSIFGHREHLSIKSGIRK